MTLVSAGIMGEISNASSRQHEAISRKQVTQATSSETHDTMESEFQVVKHEVPKPTNRDRYENKPMPELPSEVADLVVTPSRKPYIQPAVPLVNPTTPQAKRAVTDPVGPRNSSIARKPSVSHLRKVFGHAKRSSKDDRQGIPTVPYTTRKAAIILGLPQQDEVGPSPATDRNTASDDASTGHSSQDGHVAPHEASGQTELPYVRSDSQSTIGATSSRPLGTPMISISTEHDWEDSHEGPTYGSRPDIRGSLSPKIASYGQVGDKAFVHDQKLFRVESVQGIIEHTESPRHADSDPNNQKYGATLQELQKQDQKQSEISNGPDGYKGIWENDPAVVSNLVTRCHR